MFEGRDYSSLVPHHTAWGQLLILEKIGEELCDQGNRGSKRICSLYTTPSTENSPFSIIDGLGGQRLGAAILSAVSLEKPAFPRDLLTASKLAAVECLGPIAWDGRLTDPGGLGTKAGLGPREGVGHWIGAAWSVLW